MNKQTSKTLAEHLRITDVDIRERKELLGLTSEVEEELFSFKAVSVEIVDSVVDEFYQHQIKVPKIRNFIGDADTLVRLRNAMKSYILGLFDGEYGADYVNTRLRIGKAHARIGVPPKLYVSSLHQLENLLGRHLAKKAGLQRPPDALRKIFLLDLQFVFDTYIHGLLSDVELARDEFITYSETLEEIVTERTKQIDRLAQTDELTGLWNRRNFLSQVKRELMAAKRRNSRLLLQFIDVDDFKTVNDTLGHLAGDRILGQVGTAIKETIRASDIAFRYGGDEFCVLLPEAGLEDADTIVEKIMEGVKAKTGGDIGLSIGFSLAAPGDYPEVDAFINAADRAMYDTKSERSTAREVVKGTAA